MKHQYQGISLLFLLFFLIYGKFFYTNRNKSVLGRIFRLKLVLLMCAYDEEKNIAKAISNIPKTIQGIDQIEILVIDDGSKDNSIKIAKEVFWGSKNDKKQKENEAKEDKH